MPYLNPTQVYQLARLVNKALRDNPITPILAGSTPPKDTGGPEAWEVALKKAVNASSALPKYHNLERYYVDILEFLIYYFGDAIEAEKDKRDTSTYRRMVKAGGGGWSSKTVE